MDLNYKLWPKYQK